MYSAVIPSVSHLTKRLFRYLSHHPLFIHPLVFHPITLEHVPISQYRFMGGIPTSGGLTCSIYPGFSSSTEDASPSPATISASVLYKPYTLGHTYDEARYHFLVEFFHRATNVDGLNRSTDPSLITAPSEALVYPEDMGFIDLDKTKNLDLALSPSLDIVSDYLELTRLALCDITHHKDFFLGDCFPGTLNNIEIIHQNFPTTPWSSNSSAVFFRGYLLFSLTAFVSRGWRDKLIFPLQEISLDTKE